MPAYPAALDALGNPTATTKRNAAGFELSVVISTLNDIVEALENKVGIGADVAAVNELLVGTGAGATAFRKLLNADVDAAAAIAYSKLALGASIVNADVAAAAAIAYSKLNLTASIVNADMAAGAHFKKIGEIVANNTSDALVFSSIPATYRSLRVEATLRSAVGAANTTVGVYINADGGGNYDSQYVQSQAGTVTSAEAFAGTVIPAGYVTGNSGPAAGIASEIILELPDYAQTVHQKLICHRGIGKYGTATTNIIVREGWTAWRNTAAINSIDIRSTSGFWISGQATLWGLPA